MPEGPGRRSIVEAAFSEGAVAVTVSSIAPAGNVHTEAITVPAATHSGPLRGYFIRLTFSSQGAGAFVGRKRIQRATTARRPFI
jgi:hypothetical protein